MREGPGLAAAPQWVTSDSRASGQASSSDPSWATVDAVRMEQTAPQLLTGSRGTCGSVCVSFGGDVQQEPLASGM